MTQYYIIILRAWYTEISLFLSCFDAGLFKLNGAVDFVVVHELNAYSGNRFGNDFVFERAFIHLFSLDVLYLLLLVRNRCPPFCSLRVVDKHHCQIWKVNIACEFVENFNCVPRLR